MKAIIAALAIILASGTVQAQSVPLLDEAPSTYIRARNNAYKQHQKAGMAGLRDSVLQCYSIFERKKELRTAQYCYALHLSSIMIDKDVMKVIGSDKSTVGFSQRDLLDTGDRAMVTLGYNREQRNMMLVLWLHGMLTKS